MSATADENYPEFQLGKQRFNQVRMLVIRDFLCLPTVVGRHIVFVKILFFFPSQHLSGVFSGTVQGIDMKFWEKLGCKLGQLPVKFHAHAQCVILPASVPVRKF